MKMEQLATDTVYSVADLWCAAVAADRINEGYVKKTNYGSDQQTNRTMVRLMLLNSSGWSYGDMQLAYQYHQYWRNQMLLLLDDSAKDYDRTIAKFSSKDTVDISGEDRASVAVIASAVQTTRERIEQEKLNKIKTACDRKYIGNVGDKINITDSRFYVVLDDKPTVTDDQQMAIAQLKNGNVPSPDEIPQIIEVEFGGAEDWTLTELDWKQIALELMTDD
jgi:hypothetical protein